MLGCSLLQEDHCLYAPSDCRPKKWVCMCLLTYIPASYLDLFLYIYVFVRIFRFILLSSILVLIPSIWSNTKILALLFILSFSHSKNNDSQYLKIYVLFCSTLAHSLKQAKSYNCEKQICQQGEIVWVLNIFSFTVFSKVTYGISLLPTHFTVVRKFVCNLDRFVCCNLHPLLGSPYIRADCCNLICAW